MLSIVIPTLNEEKYLPQLLQSIQSQEFSDYEIIVSDGGSQDRTGEIAKSSGCRLVSDSAHRHPGWQRNIGAAAALGDTLLFLDADSYLQPGFLGDVVSEFQSRDLAVAGFAIKFYPNSPLYSLFALFFNAFLRLRQYYSPSAVGAGLLAKKSAHDQAGGFDTSIILVEDYDYCVRLSRFGRFRILKSHRLLYSSRRLKRDGDWNTLGRWLKMGLYTICKRRIREKVIKYDFGKF